MRGLDTANGRTPCSRSRCSGDRQLNRPRNIKQPERRVRPQVIFERRSGAWGLVQGRKEAYRKREERG